jgi:hypothetical protein
MKLHDENTILLQIPQGKTSENINHFFEENGRSNRDKTDIIPIYL